MSDESYQSDSSAYRPESSTDQPEQPNPTGPGQYPQGQYPQGQYAQGQYQPMPYGHVAPKNPAIALLVSFFIPGVGTMMNGETGKGVGILVGYVVSVFLTIIIIGIFGMLGFWIWGMVDAYQGAQKWNRAHGIVS